MLLFFLMCVAVAIGVTRPLRARVSLVRCARRGRRGDALLC